MSKADSGKIMMQSARCIGSYSMPEGRYFMILPRGSTEHFTFPAKGFDNANLLHAGCSIDIEIRVLRDDNPRAIPGDPGTSGKAGK